jgi:hypothetical protein
VSEPECDEHGEQEHNHEKNEGGRPKSALQSTARKRRSAWGVWGVTCVGADPFEDRPRRVIESVRGHRF